MKRRGIAAGVLFVLAVLCAAYGGCVLALASGSRFYLCWFLLAAGLALLGAAVRKQWLRRLPKWVRGVLAAVLVLGAALFLGIEGCIVSRMNAQGAPALDYVIVLGAQVRETGPSAVLKYRLDRAVQYLEENPETICILSGGQGANEPFPEAEGMADYLRAQGIPESRLLLETESKTTAENMTYSARLLPEGASVGILTNDFHMFRALQIAHGAGIRDACGIAADSSRFYLANNLLREFFAELKYLVFP